MIPRDRVKGLKGIRVIAHPSLSLPFLKERHLQHRRKGKEDVGISGMKFPHKTPAVIQNAISATDANNSRRYRTGQAVPVPSFGESVQRVSFQADDGSLQFRSFKKLEQEIGAIRKKIDDMGETLFEPSRRSRTSPDGTLTSDIDLNRVSAQVYREIERRIRTERERRGM
jgi:hypothetical protein